MFNSVLSADTCGRFFSTPQSVTGLLVTSFPTRAAGRRHALAVGSNECGHSSALLRSIRCRSVWPTGYDVTSRHARRPPNRNVEITDRRIRSASTGRVRRWLQLRFDCNSTALRPLDVLPQFFVLSPNLQTRGHHYKLFKQRSNTRIRSTFFHWASCKHLE